MNRSLFKNLWVGPDWRKKLLKERSGSYFRYKKFMIFQRSHFNVFLMTLAFYLIFLWKLIYMFGFILLSSLQYFISLERLVTWSRAFCSLWVHLVSLCYSWPKSRWTIYFNKILQMQYFSSYSWFTQQSVPENSYCSVVPWAIGL